MSTVHAVIPDGVDDPRRPSGGNVYDRHVLDGLRTLGWTVHEHPVPGPWPGAGPTTRVALGTTLRELPDDSLTLVDGLVVSAAPEVVAAAAARLRLVVLAHMPFGHADPPAAAGERMALAAAVGVVTTSRWTRDWLLSHYGLPAEVLHVVEPGVEPAAVAPGTSTGGELVCVAAVTPGKGHDVLLSALADVTDLGWRCTCVGALDLDPGFVSGLRRAVAASGLADRVRFTGPLVGADLDRAYDEADALVLASRGETYGMVVVEALARGLPVLATEVGGVPDALGSGTGGSGPGLLVPAGDVHALAEALRRWLTEPDLRDRLRRAATARRATLRAWPESAGALGRVLAEVLDEPPRRPVRMAW